MQPLLCFLCPLAALLPSGSTGYQSNPLRRLLLSPMPHARSAQSAMDLAQHAGGQEGKGYEAMTHHAAHFTCHVLMQELCTGSPGLEPASIVPTVGLNVGRVEAHHAQLLFWDLGGQAGLRSIWDKYFADSHALIFVVDSTRPARCASIAPSGIHGLAWTTAIMCHKCS